jgi:NCS1 family nucleobase:cation symporter-1
MPRQKWRGISIFGMTNRFEPPQRRALSDADLAAALELASQGKDGALGAMSLLEEQSQLRNQDAENYVRWVREMEADGSAEAKAAISQARRSNSSIADEHLEVSTQTPVTEDSWKSMVPDWDERQANIEEAKQQAVAEAKARAEEEAAREIEAAVAAAVAEAESEAKLRREEAVAAAKAEAEIAAAEKLAEELRIAELAASELAEQERLEAQREELIRAELEAAEQAAISATIAAEQEAEARADEIAAQLALAENELTEILDDEEEEKVQPETPQPVRAGDFATGSFDIIESAEQAASEEFDEENFDVLLADGELGYAREPESKSSSTIVSTIERRAKPFSQLFVWSSLTVGIAPIVLAFISLGFDLTVLDRITAVFAGAVISALLISVIAIAGKRSGLSTLFLSRSAFGVNANFVPALIQILAKLVIGSVVILGAVGLFNSNIEGAPKFGDEVTNFGSLSVNWLLVITSLVLLFSSVLALLGGKVLYWAQVGVAAVGALAVLLFIGFTAGSISLSSSAFTFSSNWLTLVGFVAAVSSAFAALWLGAVADFTRKIPMSQSGKRVVLFVSLATAIIPLLLTSFGVLLSGNLGGQARLSAIANPLGAILNLVPDWLASVVLVSGALTLLAWASSWLYSTSVSLAVLSRKLRRYISQPLALVLALAVIVLLSWLEQSQSSSLAQVLVPLASVAVYAWAGIFCADIALRRIAYHEVSLTRDYGFYKSVNWLNLVAFVASVAIGLGFVSAEDPSFAWLGYIAKNIGAGDWASSNVGIFISLGFSALFPILFGRKRIAAQEAEVLKIEARKSDLDDVAFAEGI